MVTTGKSKKTIRIYVSTPGDVLRERETLRAVVAEFNRTGQIAEQMGLNFEVADWSTYTDPHLGASRLPGSPPPVIEKWDLFIGVLWLRFESSINRMDSSTVISNASGTEDEFNRAYESWKRNARPQVLFYRCRRPHPPVEIDKEQVKRVNGFFERFEHDGQHPRVLRVFADIPEFARQVRDDLLEHLKQFETKSVLSISKLGGEKGSPATTEKQTALSVPQSPVLVPGSAMAKALRSGEVVNLALLSVDIVDHSKLFKTYQFGELKILLDKFYDFVYEIIKGFEGDQISWAGDGGLFAFWGENACDRAVLAGIKLQLDIIVFNLSNKINILKDSIKLRIAGHYGAVAFEFPTEKIHSSHINFVAHLEKNATTPETFSVSRCLWDELSECLQDVLEFDKKYQNSYIYTYRLPTSKTHISVGELGKILGKIQNQNALLIESIRMAVLAKNDMSDYEAMRRNIDLVYNHVEHFINGFHNIDTNWSQDYFKTLVGYTENILKEDEILSEKIDDFYYKSDEAIVRDQGLFDIIKFIGVRKTNAIPNLRLLLKQFEFYAAGEKGASGPMKNELLLKVDNLINADNFNEEMTFFDLFLNEKEALVEYILNEPREKRYRKLVARLWKLADFVLIEDITLRRQRATRQLKLIFPVLCRDGEWGNYFKIVLDLFQGEPGLEILNAVLERFEFYGIKPRESDIVTVLKCLLVGSTRQETRKRIVELIDFRELWEIIAYSETPLEVMQVIAEYLLHHRDGNRMKNFFDLTLNKLLNLVNIANRETVLHQVRLMIIIFYRFDFFAETGYYERLEDLRLNFMSKAKHFPNAKLDILDNYFKELKKRRETNGSTPASVPEGVGDMPLPIQRRLANEGRHLRYFITSSNEAIALDTIRYININNITHILRAPRINDVLLGWLLKNKELFRSTSAAFMALNHPKCNMTFAEQHMSRLSEEQKEKIADNTFANQKVRDYARDCMRINNGEEENGMDPDLDDITGEFEPFKL